MIGYDIVTRLERPIDDHAGSAFFYLNVLQRHHYEWLVVAAAALLLAWPGRARLQRWIAASPSAHGTAVVIAAWFLATLIIPSAIATKTQWYLNSFYPLFAVLVAVAVSHALDVLREAGRMVAARVLVVLVVAGLVIAEAKLAYRSFTQLDLGRSPQQLLLRQAPRLAGRRVLAETCPFPEDFLARVAGATCVPMGHADAAAAGGRARRLRPGADADHGRAVDGRRPQRRRRLVPARPVSATAALVPPIPAPADRGRGGRW